MQIYFMNFRVWKHQLGILETLLKTFPDNKKLEAKIAIFYYRSGQLKDFERYREKLENNNTGAFLL